MPFATRAQLPSWKLLFGAAEATGGWQGPRHPSFECFEAMLPVGTFGSTAVNAPSFGTPWKLLFGAAEATGRPHVSAFSFNAGGARSDRWIFSTNGFWTSLGYFMVVIEVVIPQSSPGSNSSYAHGLCKEMLLDSWHRDFWFKTQTLQNSTSIYDHLHASYRYIYIYNYIGIHIHIYRNT